MLLMIDNYDSFTYNLVQYFGELGEDVRVFRNDEITLDQIEQLTPDRICISPGPCSPNEAGVSLGVFERFAGRVPILGVCLGHQALGQAFGGKVVRAQTLMHGKTSPIAHTGVGVFAGLADPVRSHALSLARGRARLAAGLPGSDRVDRRWRDHGPAPQDAAGRRRAVPSGVDRHRARPRDAEELPSGEAMMLAESLASAFVIAPHARPAEGRRANLSRADARATRSVAYIGAKG